MLSSTLKIRSKSLRYKLNDTIRPTQLTALPAQPQQQMQQRGDIAMPQLSELLSKVG